MRIFQVGGIGFDSNIYLIKGIGRGDPSALVDAGTGFNWNWVLGQMKLLEKLRNIEAIFLTHEHFDHIGGVPKIIQAIERRGGSVKVFAHKILSQALRTGNVPSARMFNAEAPQFEVGAELVEGREIELGCNALRVLHTPGHSPGSISLLDKNDGSLFCGDLIFANGGVGRWDLSGGDRETLQDSIQKLAELDIRGIYPGHGPYSDKNGRRWIELSLSNLKNCG
jgi:glyoxylase-like metal-dependent hydrolase (beta-lactamase superfamily II)